MMPACLFSALMVVMVMTTGSAAHGSGTDLRHAKLLLKKFNRRGLVVQNDYSEKAWNYETNITDENEQAYLDADLSLALWKKKMARKAARFDTTDFPASMKRQFDLIRDIGTAAMGDTSKLEQLNKIQADMLKIYSTGEVCLEENNCLPLEPDIYRAFETSRDEDFLRRLWSGWRDASGKKMRQLYTQYVSLSNEAVQNLGYTDAGAYWRSWYETETFEQDVADLFEELKPFYQQLHAFARRRLRNHYGEDLFPSSGHIPAHLLGNNWAQYWNTLQDLLTPFPGKPMLDVTTQMVKQNYTARRIFETADDFFTSLGLEPMFQSFWEDSMLEKPTDGRDVVCQPSAWDFYNGKDFRVKQCTDVTMSHLNTAHHEMGHIVYQMLYRHQPLIFRDGANPGFHEAVGDTIALSVQTPKHLHQIGLLPTLQEDNEVDINFLMAMALRKIVFLPYAYILDLFRWSVFRGDTTPDNYTQAWWDLRCNLQGVYPPVERTEEDFDPGSKFHVPANVDFIRYFVSYIIQFQFHKALCEAAGHQGPLHTCDIYSSTAAGDKLRAMLSKGRAEVWTVPFQAMTGQTKMSAEPLIEYFQPLMDFLVRSNEGEEVGWKKGCP